MVPLLKNMGRLNNYIGIYFEDWTQIKNQVCNGYNNWIKKIKKIKNAYIEISNLSEFYWYYKPENFYTKCEEILKRNLNEGIKEFINEIKNFKDEAESKDITFEGLAYHIMFNTNNILNPLHNSFPSYIKEILDYDFQYYNKNSSSKDDQNLALYNYILKLRDIFTEKENELNRNNKKIMVTIPEIVNEQMNLLYSYYSIREKENFEYQPKIISNYQRQIRAFNKNNSINEEKGYEKYLIIGNDSKAVDINEKPNLNLESKDFMNLKLDNSITIILPEIKLSDYKENISLNGISELYNKSIIGSRIFPAYLHNSIINEKEENLKSAKNYFEILLSIFKNIKENDNSFINEKSKEFNSSFQDMIVKLKNAGINFNSNKTLN